MAKKAIANLVNKVKNATSKNQSLRFSEFFTKKNDEEVWGVSMRIDTTYTEFSLWHYGVQLAEVLMWDSGANNVVTFKPSNGWSHSDKAGVKDILNALCISTCPSFDGATARYPESSFYRH